MTPDGSTASEPGRRAPSSLRHAGAHKALGTGDLLRSNTSDGTLAGDAAQVKKHTTDGAKLGNKVGAAVGGVGAPVGAAIGAGVGAGLGAVKSKRGRYALAGIIIAPPLLMAVAVTVMLSMFASMMASFQGSDAEAAASAAIADGLTHRHVTIYAEAAAAANVPWEILAALVREQGTDPDATVSAHELDQLIASNEPVGAFAIVPKTAANSAKELGIRDLDPTRFAGLETAAEFTAETFAKQLSSSTPSVNERGLSAGTVLVEDGRDGAQKRIINADDPADAKAAEKVQDAYVKALEKMPVANASGIAQVVYATALAWHLGGAVACLPADGGAIVTGEWANPISGPFTNVHESSDYRSGGHVGVDIDTPNDADLPLYAAGSGVVIWAEKKTTSYGNHIKIDHGGGVVTLYAHLARLLVAKGDTVRAGQQIGFEGTTGHSTGDHLHFEVHQNGVPIDPVAFFAQRGVTLGAPGAPGSATTSGDTGDTGDTAGDPGAVPTSFTATRADGVSVTLSKKQLGYAAQIIGQVQAAGLGENAATIALMTALQESTLLMYANSKVAVSLSYPHDAVGNDGTSVGLFQQMERWGWGTHKQLMDPVYSTKAFLGGPTGPNGGSPAGLLDIAGWETKTYGEAAQAVQGSAFPDEYDKWQPVAEELVAKVTGTSAVAGCGTGANTGSDLPEGSPEDVKTVIAAAKSQLGVDYSWGGGGPGGPSYGIDHGRSVFGFDCSGLTEYAFAKAGYAIGTTSREQILKGQVVASQAAALPGDLIFWSNNGTDSGTYHVAIYLGGGEMIEAPRTGLKVRIVAVSAHGSAVYKFVRIIQPESDDHHE